MERLSVCPSTLAEGFDSYSPTALKSLFDGINVSPILPFNSPNSDSGDNSDYAQHIGRISLLFREGMHLTDVRSVCRADFEEFGHRIGLSARIVKRELDFFAAEHPLAQLLIEHSFLPEKLKRYYRLSYDYRRTTLA